MFIGVLAFASYTRIPVVEAILFVDGLAWWGFWIVFMAVSVFMFIRIKRARMFERLRDALWRVCGSRFGPRP